MSAENFQLGTADGGRWTRLLGPLLVSLLALGVYANTLSLGFSGDDQWLILDNPVVVSLDFASAMQTQGQLWRPLTSVSVMLDYALWGPDRTYGFHLTNVLLHLAVCLALYALMLRIGLSSTTATVTAALFAVHPVHVEAVANISHRKEPLALLFIVLAFLSYLASRDPGVRGPLARLARAAGVLGPDVARRLSQVECLVWTALFYLLGMLSKEVAAVMLPATIVSYELVAEDGRRRLRQMAWLVVPLAGVLVLFLWRSELSSLASPFSSKQIQWVSMEQTGSYGPFLLGVLVAFFSHTRLVLWPWPLNFDPAFVFPQSPLDARVLAGLLLLGLMVAGLVWSRRRAPLVFFGLAWYLLHMLPVSNVVPLTYWMVTERCLYVPSVGLVLVVALGLEALWEGRLPRPSAVGQKALAALALSVLLLLFGTLTVLGNRVWKDDFTLWHHVLTVNPNSHRGHYAVGIELEQAGDLEAAESAYRKSLECEPLYIDPHYGLARLLLQQGRYEEALEAARIYATAFPEDGRPLVVMGNAHLQLGATKKAVEAYMKALALAPLDNITLVNLASATLADGRPEAALRVLEGLPPEAGGRLALLIRGQALSQLKRLEEALSVYKQAQQLDPNDALAARAAGIVALKLGLREQGIADLEHSLELNPQQPAIRDLLDRLGH